MKTCTQLCEPGGTPCPSAAEFSYFWPPDGNEYHSCFAHTRAVRRIGEAVGVKIVLRRIALEEARRDVIAAAVGLWLKLPPEEERRDDVAELVAAVEKLVQEEQNTAALQRAELEALMRTTRTG